MAVSMRSAVAPIRAARVVRASVKPAASLQSAMTKAIQVVGVTGVSLALAFSASADGAIKLGADSGELVFVPNSITIKAGESVSFTNNAGFPHNVVFDEDNVPAGVNADGLSHEEYLNAPGESFSVKLEKAGTYGYYCEPHQGAGMAGKIIVQ